MNPVEYKSPVKLYSFGGEPQLKDEEFEGLAVREIVEASGYDDLDAEIQSYRVIVSASVPNEQVLDERRLQIGHLVSELDRLWTYVAGYPLSTRIYGRALVPAPDAAHDLLWVSNYGDLKDRFERNQRLGGSIGIMHRRWMKLPRPPLASVLEARKRFGERAPAEQRLIDMHYGVFRTAHLETRMLVLAKCLELASSMLAGSGAREKTRSLPGEARYHLTKSLDWLFMIANTRQETRHTVRQSSADLHPNLSDEERDAFVWNTHLIVRVMGCCMLGLEPIVLQSQ